MFSLIECDYESGTEETVAVYIPDYQTALETMVRMESEAQESDWNVGYYIAECK